MLMQFMLVLLLIGIVLGIVLVSAVIYLLWTDENRGLLHPKYMRRDRGKKAPGKRSS